MMSSNIVFSECQNSVHCKYSLIPNKTLQTVLLDFYNVESIIETKQKLFEIVKEYNVNVFKYSCNFAHKGEAKKKSECDDLINKVLDKEKCNLPRFVAEYVNKLPPIKISDADVCTFIVQNEATTEFPGDYAKTNGWIYNVTTSTIFYWFCY